MRGLVKRVRGDGAAERDAGFTLIEMLVGLILVALIGTMLFGAVLATQHAAESSRQVNDLNGEARLVLNRMSRELREAQRITAVTNPDGPGHTATGDVSVTFEVDFNGNGSIEPTAADPEVLTYYYDHDAHQLQLRAAGASLPVLAANVSQFNLDFTSRRYIYDGTTDGAGGVCGTVSATKDGVVEWSEVDGNSARLDGNCNGVLDQELNVVDSAKIDLRVLNGPKQQQYVTQVDLRNATA
jgi:prepilin-type N-terminal cleavage/methylation domain-containing protein